VVCSIDELSQTENITAHQKGNLAWDVARDELKKYLPRGAPLAKSPRVMGPEDGDNQLNITATFLQMSVHENLGVDQHD